MIAIFVYIAVWEPPRQQGGNRKGVYRKAVYREYREKSLPEVRVRGGGDTEGVQIPAVRRPGRTEGKGTAAGASTVQQCRVYTSTVWAVGQVKSTLNFRPRSAVPFFLGSAAACVCQRLHGEGALLGRS